MLARVRLNPSSNGQALQSKKGSEHKKKEDLRVHAPKSLNADLIRRFCEYLKKGVPIDITCDLLSISVMIYSHWKKKGENWLNSDGSNRERGHEIYAYFVQEMRKAVGEYKTDRIIKAHTLMPGLWQRELAILERRDRKNFSKYENLGGEGDVYEPDERFL
jgi:hypothetical protein